MIDQKINLIVGALLHDIGKVIYRDGSDRRNHSIAGYDYLKEEAKISNKEILNCVRYHHAALLKNASLKTDDLAYIVYAADNIAAFTDRRKKEEVLETGFEMTAPLQSVFNRLNGNKQEFYYHPGTMSDNGEINYPSAEKIRFSKDFYGEVRRNMTDCLAGVEWNDAYLNSLLSVLEANLSYVPSSTAKDEVSDVSLYDHVKLTAALASCMYDYLNEKALDYRETLFSGSAFYDEKAFLLYSMDTSGIQNFIYTIASKNALKTLRARSFYLEILLEHMADLLLTKLELSRANLLYSGGGHCYFLFANTQKTLETLRSFQTEMNEWFMEQFQIDLYIACGFAPCSGNNLRNIPEGSYADLYRQISKEISGQKLHRYTPDQIIRLNRRMAEDYTRECKVCRRIGHVNEDGVCVLCEKFERLSANVLYSDFFTVSMAGNGEGLPLPGNCILNADNEKTVKEKMKADPYFVRTYSKNKMYTGMHTETKLWVGDYTTKDTFQDLAQASRGIKRIGVLRADVDNLGQTFVSGLGKYDTLSRTATLSRQLSIFFKFFIRSILEEGAYSIEGGSGKKKRRATIVYSGGDDVFIVGAWDDIIEFAVDLRRSLEKYTQGTLTLSAGIGIFGASYPIAAIARETGEMEAESKRMPQKNAVTLMEDGESHSVAGAGGEISDGTYTWEAFEKEVLGEKYKVIDDYLRYREDKGMSFLYRMLELIRNRKEKINFARMVYLLARLEPEEKEISKDAYHEFSNHMYRWMQSDKDCRQLKTAINLYAYRNRDSERGE